MANRGVMKLAVVLLLAGPLCSAQEIVVAAASDLQFAFQDVAARFEKDTGHAVKLTFGSSGNFFTQIQNGAPFDLYFSADIDYPRRLAAAGLTEPGTIYQYATGKIVLWVRNESRLDVNRGLPVLLDPSIQKIAIANPEHAPYGRAAVAAMKHENIYDQVKSKFVLGENISQTTSFVVSGSADIGIVALSLALAPSMKERGKYFEVPAGEYSAIDQAAVILKSSANKDLARQLMTYLKTPAIQDLMRSYGFSLPVAAKARQETVPIPFVQASRRRAGLRQGRQPPPAQPVSMARKALPMRPSPTPAAYTFFPASCMPTLSSIIPSCNTLSWAPAAP